MESVAEFRERARQWLESQASYRTADTTTQRWGEGEFSVTVFHDVSDAEEIEHVGKYKAWHDTKVAAGFGAIEIGRAHV